MSVWLIFVCIILACCAHKSHQQRNCTTLDYYGYYRDDCRFRCHCAHAGHWCSLPNICTVCDINHREPPNCRKKNVAFNASSVQSSSYNWRQNGPPTNAVDGSYSNYLFSNTGVGTKNWLRVNLGKTRVVNHINLFVRQETCYDGNNYHCSRDIQEVQIYVTNQTQNTSVRDRVVGGVVCYSHNGSSLRGVVPLQINCNPPIYGKYIVVYQLTHRHLSIVELEVFECEDFSFGDDCKKVCNCRDQTEVCDKIDGSCPRSGCPLGYYVTPGCQTACNAGYFGENCVKSCHCLGDVDCDDVNGQCPVFDQALCRTSSECTLDGTGMECVFLHQPCDVGNCRCPDGMVNDNRECVKESKLHEECQSSDQCLAAYCRDNLCQCRDSSDEYMGQCKENNKYKIGEECSENSECVYYNEHSKSLEGTLCSEGVCICSEDTIMAEERCKKRVLGDGCRVDSQCGINGAFCEEGTCQCRRGYRNINSRRCLLNSDIGKLEAGEQCGVEKKCQEDLDCKKCHPIAKNKTCVYLSSGRPTDTTVTQRLQGISLGAVILILLVVVVVGVVCHFRRMNNLRPELISQYEKKRIEKNTRCGI